MADLEVRRETGTSLMFMGLTVWVGDLLVLFFLPAGFKQGRQQAFFAIMLVLFLLGAFLMIRGYLGRRKAGPEE
jgi:hypothetical protein